MNFISECCYSGTVRSDQVCWASASSPACRAQGARDGFLCVPVSAVHSRRWKGCNSCQLFQHKLAPNQLSLVLLLETEEGQKRFNHA